ncbi:MAG: DUF177 domain-containing protein [Ilumatobacter sp.]|nr:DUF177 domain-containing protein [Ilumatobacter sp.]MDG2040070.1 DUF177 domain-containing protein [Ilumatobacter sp.]
MEAAPKRELRINAVELLRQPGAVRSVEVTVPGGDLDVDHEALAGVIGVALELEALNDGIVVRGGIEAPWERPCRRCLKNLKGLARADIDEIYQVEILDEDAFPIVDGQLDLAPMARQAALLELDDERLCRDDCAGLCPQCGDDRNAGKCDCDTEVTDHRWAALDGLVLDD